MNKCEKSIKPILKELEQEKELRVQEQIKYDQERKLMKKEFDTKIEILMNRISNLENK